MLINPPPPIQSVTDNPTPSNAKPPGGPALIPPPVRPTIGTQGQLQRPNGVPNGHQAFWIDPSLGRDLHTFYGSNPQTMGQVIPHDFAPAHSAFMATQQAPPPQTPSLPVQTDGPPGLIPPNTLTRGGPGTPVASPGSPAAPGTTNPNMSLIAQKFGGKGTPVGPI